MRLRTILLVLALLAVFSAAVGGYLQYTSIIESAMGEAKRNADSQANTLRGLVSSFLATNQMALEALAAMEPLHRALVSSDPEARAAANAVLDRFKEAFAVSVCYLLNNAGTTVASSNRDDPDSFMAKNYAFRDYFKQAIQGVPTLSVALGATSQKRGIYCSHPVYNSNQDKPIGVVVIKAPVEPVEKEFLQIQAGMVLFTDSSGVIFASNRHDWVYRPLWELTPREIARIAETRQYGEGPREWTGMKLTGEGHALDRSGIEYLVSRSVIQEGWNVFYLISLEQTRREVFKAFMQSSAPFMLILCVLVGSAVSYLYGIASKDIAQKKITEEALRESEARYRSLFENNHAVMLLIDPETGSIVDANPAACAYYGYSLEQLRSKRLTEINTLTPEQLFEEMGKARAEQRRHFFFRHRLANGEIHPVEVYSGPIELRGKKLLCSIVHDVTERRAAEEALLESEERFRHIAELSPFPMAILDPDGRYIFLNKKFVEVFGYTLAELPTGKAWFRLAFPDPQVRKEVIATWVSDLDKSAKYQVRPREYLVHCKDGKSRNILFRPVTLEGNQQFITYEDLTEQRQLGQERLKLAKLESVGVLAGGIAHDFNNLLTAILGYISLAKLDASRTDKVIARLEEAEKAAARAKDLTAQLLTFSKGGAPVKKTMFLQGVIEESCKLILSGSRSRCELEVAPDLWPVEVDEGQIAQVITNVTINADQSMSTGGTIRVRAANRTLEASQSLPLEPGRYVQIDIEDEGVGIAGEELPRIFDPYFTTKQSGSGLGLATVHSIVAKHGGYVTAASKVGQGTTITIYLPAARGESGHLEVPLEGRTFNKGAGRILVMDDEEIIRELAKEMLTFLGYEVELAENGEQAIARYQTARARGEPFGVVLLDLTVRGGMGGREAVEVLRSLDPEVRAIVSSGYSHDPVMAEFRKHGFVGVVSKPYSAEELSNVLRKVLAKSPGGCR